MVAGCARPHPFAAEQSPPEEDLVPVLVAKKKVKALTLLKNADRYFEVQEKPRNAVPGNALSRFDELRDYRANKVISEGSILTRDDLVSIPVPFGAPEGTWAVALTLHKDQKVPDDIALGMDFDIVGEISEPIKTGIALLNVKLLAVDSRRPMDTRPWVVTVLLTTAQREVLALMEKHGTKLEMKPRSKVVTFPWASTKDK